MTQARKRKMATRAVQEATGLRYTAALRVEAASRTAIGQPVPLSALLAECATQPEADVDWGEDVFTEYVPEVFESALLGGAVPYVSVLALAGALSAYGPRAEVRVESLEPLWRAVVASGRRRFRIGILCGSVDELCRAPGCPEMPVMNGIIEYCEGHLATCNAHVLVGMARHVGIDVSTDGGDDLERRGGSPEAEILILAASARGAFAEVRDAFVHSAFMNPSDIDELYMGETAAIDMRHAIEREEMRLLGLARAEYQRIRKAAGTCRACPQDLTYRHVDLQVPPDYYTAECTPSAPSNPAPDPWENAEKCPF
ncbi:hypothetical protein [Streptomyces sp. NBC_00073]|uniref:hypothetical protein n=1 Tax=Streptomyces sp. NBC_00073 TaxID=2975640 RepID=UPI0032540305